MHTRYSCSWEQMRRVETHQVSAYGIILNDSNMSNASSFTEHLGVRKMCLVVQVNIALGEKEKQPNISKFIDRFGGTTFGSCSKWGSIFILQEFGTCTYMICIDISRSLSSACKKGTRALLIENMLCFHYPLKTHLQIVTGSSKIHFRILQLQSPVGTHKWSKTKALSQLQWSNWMLNLKHICHSISILRNASLFQVSWLFR